MGGSGIYTNYVPLASYSAAGNKAKCRFFDLSAI